MKIEDKKLLLQDLCARLPYGVKVKTSNINVLKLGTHTRVGEYVTDVSEPCKSYLFPLSSMTEEQYKEYTDMGYSVTERWWSMANYHQIEWFNKNHFDYRGLIEKGLAIDCTNLNIY